MQRPGDRVLWLVVGVLIAAVCGCIQWGAGREATVPTEEAPKVGAVEVKTPAVEAKEPEAPEPAEPKVEPVPEPPPAKPKVDITTKKMTFKPLDISVFFNASAVSGEEGLDGWGNAYPADKLPSGEKVAFEGELPKGLVFTLPDYQQAEKNVLTADGQTIKVPADTYTAIFLLAAATNGTQQSRMKLIYDGSEASRMLRISDWCGKATFGEIEAGAYPRVSGENEEAECKLYVQALILDPDKKLEAITLPVNKNIHIFAMTLAQ